MNPTLVLVPPQRDSTADWPERLMSDVPGLTVVRPAAKDAAAALRTADAAYGVLTDELLAATTKLRWLQAQQAAPPPDFFSPALIAHPLQLTNMRDTYTDHVAAHTLALVLAMCRGLPRYIRDQQSAAWEPNWDPASVTSLADSTALVVGIGAVGKEIGRLLHSFGCTVTGIDVHPRLAAGFEAVLPVEELDQQLPQADLVILTVPHTPDTEGMIDARRLKLFKPSAYFVNVGRGPTVQLDALTAALEAGQLGGVALDVFETEPLPPVHPLWSRPDVLITPHVAGAGPHEAERRYAVLLENCRRFVAGEELTNIVDKTKRF